MTRGEASFNKVHYKGQEEDFLVFVDDVETFKKWKDGDKTIPMADFVGSFKVFVTHKQGAEGTYDGASKSTLHNEFGTDKDDDVIKVILEKGNMQHGTAPAHHGDRNVNQGSRIGH